MIDAWLEEPCDPSFEGEESELYWDRLADLLETRLLFMNESPNNYETI